VSALAGVPRPPTGREESWAEAIEAAVFWSERMDLATARQLALVVRAIRNRENLTTTPERARG
jgi:hypothetical protein